MIKAPELPHNLCYKETKFEELNKEEMSQKLVPNFQLAPLFCTIFFIYHKSLSLRSSRAAHVTSIIFYYSPNFVFFKQSMAVKCLYIQFFLAHFIFQLHATSENNYKL
jgi:hypothetical protein